MLLDFPILPINIASLLVCQPSCLGLGAHSFHCCLSMVVNLHDFFMKHPHICGRNIKFKVAPWK